MARIRTIKPGFFKHGDLYDAEQEFKMPLRIAYAGLWTVADREGRFKWKPRDLKPDILPYDDVNMVDVMSALEAKGFIQKYIIDGQEFGYIPAFLQHQHVNMREPVSNIPEPPKNKNARAKRVPSPDRNDEEGKGREGKENISVAGAPFDKFWNSCPKKTGRGSAEKAWPKACLIADPDTIIIAMSRYAESQIGKDRAYIKTPGPWLNEKRWLDDGIAPVVATDEAQEAARGAWNGEAGTLVDKIGVAPFQAYFATAKFDPGPPARIWAASSFLRGQIERKFGGALKLAYGEVILGVAA